MKNVWLPVIFLIALTLLITIRCGNDGAPGPQGPSGVPGLAGVPCSLPTPIPTPTIDIPSPECEDALDFAEDLKAKFPGLVDGKTKVNKDSLVEFLKKALK